MKIKGPKPPTTSPAELSPKGDARGVGAKPETGQSPSSTQSDAVGTPLREFADVLSTESASGLRPSPESTSNTASIVKQVIVDLQAGRIDTKEAAAALVDNIVANQATHLTEKAIAKLRSALHAALEEDPFLASRLAQMGAQFSER